VNINLPKNKEIFGIGYLRMSLFVFIIVFGTIVLFHGYSHNQEMNFINGNNPNLITVTSCACCGGKTTLLFMGVVISVYFIRVIVIGI
jgi:hypothetical protein